MVTLPNKQPAVAIPVKISATGINENEKKDLKPNGRTNSEDKTNKEGEAEFAVDSCAECHTIKILVRSDKYVITSFHGAYWLTLFHVKQYTGSSFEKDLHTRGVMSCIN